MLTGIYVGSFDLFHIGHLEVAQVVLQFVDRVIIVPNNPNKSKIFRSELKYQLKIRSELKLLMKMSLR